MIKGENLSYTYPSGQRINFPDFTFEQGSQWLILGPSGSGKTTLLQLLAGLRKPDQGALWMDDRRLDQMNNQELDDYRGAKIGIVFQKAHFVESLTVGDNLLLAQYLAGKEQHPKQSKAMLSSLGLTDKWQRMPQALSQGERQRVSLARALCKSPKVLLADEPSSALDDQNTENVIDLLKKEAKNAGATLILVTHDQRLKDNFSQKIELT